MRERVRTRQGAGNQGLPEILISSLINPVCLFVGLNQIFYSIFLRWLLWPINFYFDIQITGKIRQNLE